MTHPMAMTGVAAASPGTKSTRVGAKIPKRSRPSPAKVSTSTTATTSIPSASRRSEEIESEEDFLRFLERWLRRSVLNRLQESETRVLGVGTTTVRETFSVLGVGILRAPTHADQYRLSDWRALLNAGNAWGLRSQSQAVGNSLKTVRGRVTPVTLPVVCLDRDASRWPQLGR